MTMYNDDDDDDDQERPRDELNKAPPEAIPVLLRSFAVLRRRASSATAPQMRSATRIAAWSAALSHLAWPSTGPQHLRPSDSALPPPLAAGADSL